jgi:phosphoribosylglycinamide formyltransferase 2
MFPHLTKSVLMVFGKPAVRPYRRMAVGLAYGDSHSDVHELVSRAKKVAAAIRVDS